MSDMNIRIATPADACNTKINLLRDLRAEIARRRNRIAHDLMTCELGVQSCVRPQCISSVVFSKSAALLVLAGRKEIQFGNQTVVARAGDMLFVPAETEIWLGKYPDPRHGTYEGLGIRFDLEALRQFNTTYGSFMESWKLEPSWCARASDSVLEWITNWLNWTRRYPVSAQIQRHRLIELLLILAQQGLAGNLLMVGNPSARQRISQAISVDPARAWVMSDFCRLLGMSETALRRKLRIEGTGFREILEEARLMAGLTMVQESDWSVCRVADAVGYQSHSRFTERFKLRFGMTPTQFRSCIDLDVAQHA